MNHTDQIGEELRIMSNAVLDELLEENDVIMMDTCFAMRDEFSEFIDSIEVELMARKKKIETVVEEVKQEEIHVEEKAIEPIEEINVEPIQPSKKPRDISVVVIKRPLRKL